MITLTEFYMGRDKTYADQLTGDIQINAGITVDRVNALLEAFGQSRRVTSGWRPAEVNAATPGAAKKSNHMLGKACDLEDRDGELDAFSQANLPLLEEIGLWLESPASTPHWCHVQIVPPRSGNRVFIP